MKEMSSYISGIGQLQKTISEIEASKRNGTYSDYMGKTRNRILTTFEQKGHDNEKAEAVQEMIYLQMIGAFVDTKHDYDFNIITLVASDDYSIKRMAYYGISQLLEKGSNAIFMSTGSIGNDLKSTDPLRKDLALSVLPQIFSPHFAETLSFDIALCFSSSKQNIQQKAICTFFQVALNYPKGVKAGLQTLNPKKLLSNDSDSSLHLAVLSLLYELSIDNGELCLTLLPTFNKMLSNIATPMIAVKLLGILQQIIISSNDATRVKIWHKLKQTIYTMLDESSTSSVILELIRLICAVCQGKLRSPELITLAAKRAMQFIENKDPNLQYLGSTSMTKLMVIDRQIFNKHQDLTTECLSSPDPTHVYLAVDLLKAIACDNNFDAVIDSICDQIDARPPGYVRESLIQTVIDICQTNDYALVQNFINYADLLISFHLDGSSNTAIAKELETIALRVEGARPSLTSSLVDVFRQTTQDCMAETAAFVLGEYSTHETADDAFAALLDDTKVHALPPQYQAVCLSNAFKIYAKSDDKKTSQYRAALLKDRLPYYVLSAHPGVQETASILNALVTLFDADPDIEALQSLYADPMKAIAPGLQSRIKPPDCLLTPICSLEPEAKEKETAPEEAESIYLLPPALLPIGEQPAGQNPGRTVRIRGRIRDIGKPMTMDPVEGGDIQLDSRPHEIRKSGKIDFDMPLKDDEMLPSLQPYGNAANTQTPLPKRSTPLTHQEWEDAGMAVSVIDIRPLSSQLLSATLEITNLDPNTIEALEFNVGSGFPIQPFPNCRIDMNATKQIAIKLPLKQPLTKPLTVTTHIIPTGGSGNQKIPIHVPVSTCLVEAAVTDVGGFLNKCTFSSAVQLTRLSTRELFNNVKTIMHTHRRPFQYTKDGVNMAGVCANSGDSLSAAFVVTKDQTCVMSNNQDLAESIAHELNQLFNGA